MQQQAGLSLLELMLALIMIALSTAIAIPGMQQLLSQAKQKLAVIKIEQLVAEAHYQALARHTPTILCGSSDAKNCDGNWQQQIILFTSPADKPFCQTNSLLLANYRPDPNWRLTVKAFAHSNYLHFSPQGLLGNNNGSFYLHLGPKHSITISISKSGHTHVSPS